MKLYLWKGHDLRNGKKCTTKKIKLLLIFCLISTFLEMYGKRAYKI